VHGSGGAAAGVHTDVWPRLTAATPHAPATISPRQELKEEYFAHLLRPGTPSKTFRIRCFAFAASEEPLTPDEILEGRCFFR
jgi:hypothetical protein